MMQGYRVGLLMAVAVIASYLLGQQHAGVPAFILVLGLVIAALIAWLMERRHYQQQLAERDERANVILRGEREPGPEDESRPWARAYNRLLQELKTVSAERHELAEEIRAHSFEDRLTGLGNRHFFDSRFEVYARAREEASGGMVMLLQLNDLPELADGSQAVQDDILKQTAVLLEGATRELPQSVVARRGPADFALLLPRLALSQVPSLAVRLQKALNSLVLPPGKTTEDLSHIGIVQYRAGDEPYAILAQADMALRTAQLQGPNSWYMFEQGDMPSEQIRGSVRWRTLLETALERRSLVIHYQGAYAADGATVLHYEALSRLPDEKGELIKAAVFLPMARSLGLAVQLDRLAVDLIIKQLLMGSDASNDARISINLSAESLLSPQFIAWLRLRLAEHPKLAARVMFEIDEYAVARDGEGFGSAFLYLRELDCRLCVDHVGLALTKSHYLSEQRFDYVKLHNSIVRNIDASHPNQLFVRSLHSLCVDGGMQLLAEGVETDAEWQMLLSLGVNGGQGYRFGEPKAGLA